ncbi:hypothetical protein GCM10023067_37890 [Aminobacter aganoensis]
MIDLLMFDKIWELDRRKGVDPPVRRTCRANPEKENAMNWNQIEGNWEQFKGKVQAQWGKLTDDDLDVIKGKRKELAGRLQARYGQAQDEAEKDIDTWLSRH